MSIENISEGMGPYQILKGYLNAKGKTKSSKEEDTSSNMTSSADRVEISEDAKKLAERISLVERLKEEMKSIPEPEIRREKIGQALARMHSGYYGDKEVLDELIDALLKEGEETKSPDALGNVKVLSAGSDAEIRWDKIQEVGEKIEKLFYDRREVIDTIIDRLLGS